jgi:hypothetical protein
MSNLYQDAILDAKALRASAMANAKAALEEAFEPKIQEMIAKHLSEEEEMEEAKDHEMEEGYEKHEEGEMQDDSQMEESADINEQELDEILNQLEELDSQKDEANLNEAEEDEEEAEEGEEDEEAEEGEEDEEAAEGEEEISDDTKIIDITLGDLKQVLQSVMPTIADDTMPEPEGPEADEEAEISLEEILDELSAEGMEEPDNHEPNYKAGHNTPQEEAEMSEDFGLGATALAGGAAVVGLSALIAKIQDYYKKNPKATGAAVMNALEKVGGGAAAGARKAPPTIESSINEDFGLSAAAIGGGAAVVGLSALIAKIQDYYKKNPKATGAAVMNALEKVGGGAAAGARQAPPTIEGMENDELEEAKATIHALRKDLQEVNLLNAKYLYMNKLFKSKTLTESQKVNVINALDRATNVKEVKITYETLKESLEKKQTIKESIGFASKPAGMAPKANIVEADQFIDRWQKLAGIK